MATKTTTKKTAAAKAVAAQPAARRKLNLTRYVEATGELAAVIKQYQGLLKGIAAGRNIDVKTFDATIRGMNKAWEKFDKLSEKHEEAVFEYVDQLEAE